MDRKRYFRSRVEIQKPAEIIAHRCSSGGMKIMKQAERLLTQYGFRSMKTMELRKRHSVCISALNTIQTRDSAMD
jgi:hypothetical protein